VTFITFVFTEITHEAFISSAVFALTILSGTASFAQSPLPAESSKALPASAASDTVDVQHLIDAYHEAVLTHDGSRLARLFIPQGSTWLNVLSDEAYACAKAKSPDAVKIRVGRLHRFREGGLDLKGQLQSDTHTSAGEQRRDDCVGVL
jgi:hypothetical protein